MRNLTTAVSRSAGVRRLSALGAALVVAASGSLARAETPALQTADVTLREVAFADEGPGRARFAIGLTGRFEAPATPSSMVLRLGGLTLDVPLVNGRFGGRVNVQGATVTARVRISGRRLTAKFRGHTEDGASVVAADRAARAAAGTQRYGGMAYEFTEASLDLDGDVTPLALAVAARCDRIPARGQRYAPPQPGDTVRATLVGAAFRPAGYESPALQVVPDVPAGDWTGRVRGHALLLDFAPRLESEVKGREPNSIEPGDAAAIDLSPSATDVPGTRTLVIDGRIVTQVRFDAAVQAPPGPSTLVVRVIGNFGRVDRVTREIVAPDVVPPAAIEAEAHVLELRDDGSVFAWGDNLFGAVGDGTRLDPRSPLPVAGLTGVKQIAAGGGFSLARDAAGGVWRWGDWGATRDAGAGAFERTNIGTLTPEPVAEIADAAAVAAGDDHLLVLDVHGGVWSLGENYIGQLGIGTLTGHARHPQPVEDLPFIRGIAAGATSLAIDGEGHVYTWGLQFLRGIGDGMRPVLVEGLPVVQSISVGQVPLALADDGTVWTWGVNSDGRLGDGTTNDTDVPVRVAGLRRIVAVDAGARHCLAVDVDGHVFAWGANEHGELGDGTAVTPLGPVRVRDLRDVRVVAAGTASSYAIDEDGALWAWGSYPYRNGAVGLAGSMPTLARRTFVAGHLRRPEIPIEPAKAR